MILTELVENKQQATSIFHRFSYLFTYAQNPSTRSNMGPGVPGHVNAIWIPLTKHK